MVFGNSSNPGCGTYPLECSLWIVTWPSLSAVTSHIPYVVPPLIAIVRQKSSLVRSREFCRERVLERLRMGANRKDLFYYLVSFRTDFLNLGRRRLTERDNRVAKNSLKRSAHPPPISRRTGSWLSLLARTQQAVFSRLRSTTSYAIRLHTSTCRQKLTAPSRVEKSLWT
jgi:hypothetical protein